MNVDYDMTPRYAPESVLIVRDRNPTRLCAVTSYIVHPPGDRPKCPIVADMVVLECVTAHGSAWYGVLSAHINSELRMVVVGTNRRDEVRMGWEVAKS